MTPIPPTSDWSPPPPTRSGSRWGWGLGLLLLLGCCFWSGLGTWFLGPLIPYTANYMTWVEGNLEVIAPAQQRPGGVLSPDGRYLRLGRTISGVREYMIIDLQTQTQRPLSLTFSGSCWIPNHQFVARNSANKTYYLVNLADGVVTPAPLIRVGDTYGTTGIPYALRDRWAAAEHVYIAERLGGSAGYTVVTIEQGTPYVYWDFGSGQRNTTLIERFTADLPQAVTIPYCSSPPDHAPLVSPDGRFSAARSSGENGTLQIFDADGAVVAQAFKIGWDPSLLGWAYDSSGVYFRTTISGSAASVLVPYSSIFKLSPLTPAEAIWQWTQRISLAVMVLVGLSDPLVQRRRQKRQQGTHSTNPPTT